MKKMIVRTTSRGTVVRAAPIMVYEIIVEKVNGDSQKVAEIFDMANEPGINFVTSTIGISVETMGVIKEILEKITSSRRDK